MKILLIAGHGAGDPGACSNYGIEANETRKVLNKVKELFGGYNITVDVYPTNRNAYDDIKNGCLQVNFANYDYVFEIHFNSAASEEATGVEIWITNAEKGSVVEEKVVNKVAALGYANRGVKREDFCVIRTAKKTGTSGALIETCFISNKSDMDKYNKEFNSICMAMVNGIVEGFNISKKEGYIPPITKPTQPVITKPTTVAYRVKTIAGKQLGAYNDLNNAKKIAESNKATVFDKDNNIVASYVPTVLISEKRYAENGTFYFNTAVVVRIAPEENAKTNTQYNAGESVKYHTVILNKNGFNWIVYNRSNGQEGYMKIKDLSTGESYGYAK